MTNTHIQFAEVKKYEDRRMKRITPLGGQSFAIKVKISYANEPIMNKNLTQQQYLNKLD